MAATQPGAKYYRILSDEKGKDETGKDIKIVNDHYDREQYIKRRHHFLGKHPVFKHRTDLMSGIRYDADIVFAIDSELSVQQVRRREDSHGFHYLTPLPTTWNMQTIDDFASYPLFEWSEETEGEEPPKDNVKNVPVLVSRPAPATPAPAPARTPSRLAINSSPSVKHTTPTTTNGNNQIDSVNPSNNSTISTPKDGQACPVPGCGFTAARLTHITSHLEDEHQVHFTEESRAQGGNEFTKGRLKKAALNQWFQNEGITPTHDVFWRY